MPSAGTIQANRAIETATDEAEPNIPDEFWNGANDPGMTS
jgi:hypothetical protein